MRPTRRTWTVGALVVTLPVLAAVFPSPLPLAGAVLLGAWVLAAQYRFATDLESAQRTIAVTQSVDRERVGVGSEVTVTLTVDRPNAGLPITVKPRKPVGVSGTPPTLSLGADEHAATTTVEYTVPVAGAFTVPAPELVFREQLGLFEESITVGSTPRLTVEPAPAGSVHVGAGGEEIAPTYGEHATRRGGTGLEPAGLRKYVPGDPSNHIDWNATARLAETYVRELDAQVDREVVLIADRRASLSAGEAGRRKIDYLRATLLSMTDVAEGQTDPVGLVAVDEDELVTAVEPRRSRDQYQAVRRALYDLEPAEGGQTARTTSHVGRARTELRGETPFEARLAPFFASRTHVERVTDRPLFRAVNRASDADRARLLVIATDDERTTELREAVKLAVGRGNQVVALLTPGALFEDDTLADIEATYVRYRDFETKRRELDRAPRARAFEVGPGDRLDAILAAGRARRTEANTRE